MAGAADGAVGAVNVLVVHAHPSPDSFVGHLREVATSTLRSGGHRTDLADLYADGFDPLGTAPDPLVDGYGERLRCADALVLVHPTWWGGHPAILTGWIERVLGGGARPGVGTSLQHLRRLAVVTTHGSPRWVNLAQGEPGRRALFRVLRAQLGPGTGRSWLACYGLDGADGCARDAFVRRVEASLSRW